MNIITGKEEYAYEDKTGWDANYDYTTDMSGINFTVGGLFDFNQFKLGVVFKSPYSLTIENEDRLWDYKFSMPQMLGFGAAFAATENLTIAADYEMRKYSEA